MRRRIVILIGLSVMFCSANAATADILLQTGDLQTALSPARCWTITSLYQNGYFCESEGSGQGTVIDSGGIWVGSIHGNETLLSAEMLIDGAPATIQDGQTYSGASASFSRSTLLGPASAETYALESTMEITQDRMMESVFMTRTDFWKSVRTVYGFLSSRANRLTEYAAFDKEGRLIASGQTTADDGSFVYFSGAVSVAQYDPLTGEGVMSTVKKGAEYGLNMFIWDRAGDNKLYCRFEDMEDEGTTKTLETGAEFYLQQETLFFEATPDFWIQETQSLIPEPGVTGLLVVGGLAFLRRRSN